MDNATQSTTQKYFIYARKSTDTEDKQVRSITDQITELRLFAEREGLVVLEVLEERQSAKEPGRPVFNRVLSRIYDGEATGILAWHPDRLARNSIDGGQIIHLIDTGKLATLKFPTFWFEPTPQGKFMLSVAFGQSKYYIDNLSDNVKRGMRNKARRGEYPHQAPIGYLNDKVRKVVVPDPVRAPKIKKMFKEYASGTYCLREMRDQAPLTLQGKKPSISVTRRILSNPFYYGMFTYAGELYEGTHKPLITKKLFDKVQHVLTDKSRPKTRLKTPHAFRGLLLCAHCDCSITSSVQKGHIYYHCTRKRGNCGSKYVREETLTEEIAKALQKVSLPDRQGHQIMQKAKVLAEKEQSRSGTSAQHFQQALMTCNQKIDCLLDMSLNNEITPEEYRNKKKTLLNEKTDIKQKLKDVERKSTVWLEPLLSFISQAIATEKVSLSASLTEKAELFRSVGLNRKLDKFSVQYEPRNAWHILYSSPFLRAHRARHINRSVKADSIFPSSLPGRIRTCDLRLRRPSLYPTELRGDKYSIYLVYLVRNPGHCSIFSIVTFQCRDIP